MCGHALSVHGYNLLVNVGNVLLALLDYMWGKHRLAGLGNVNPPPAITTVQVPGLVAIAYILTVRALKFAITQMLVHPGFHHVLAGCHPASPSRLPVMPLSLSILYS